ncbi:MAG: TlpA family protein disulfide reductase [Gammaproteobacteria bacterium]|nr:TlpA family protein disulfide reductase [Gammaproteobacteria bacterium]
MEVDIKQVVFFVALLGSVCSIQAETLDQYAGKVVLLDFWASWCGPCRRSFPWMNDMQNKYENQGFVVVAVNLDRDRKDADRFLQEVPATFEVLYDAQELAVKFNVAAMPTSVLLDKKGQPITMHKGFLSKKTKMYEQAIVDALAKID